MNPLLIATFDRPLTMIPHFTKRIEVEKGYVSFYFNRIYTVEGVRYYVSVIDPNTKRVVMFQMHEKEGKWSILHFLDYPFWIVQLEAQLSEIIINHQTEAG